MEQQNAEKLSARQIEQNKSDAEKLSDWGYIGAHTLTCLTLDFAKPLISAWRGKVANGRELGELYKEHLTGEIISDFAAIPATIAVQRFAPEVTSFIGDIFKPFYHFVAEQSSNHEAENWAHRNNIDENSKEFHDFRKQKYDYEMQKMPLQATWTIVSAGLNIGLQAALFKKEEGIWETAKEVAVGNAATMLIQNLSRIIFPEATHNFDARITDISKSVVNPLTKIIAGNNLDKSNPERNIQRLYDYSDALSLK
jgi:hypothetical protein